MNLSDQLSTAEAAALVGVSIPTLLRYAGVKEGRGMLFPNPTKLGRRLFTWDAEAIQRWVNLNGKAPPTKRGRPRGSLNRPKVFLPESDEFSYSPEA